MTPVFGGEDLGENAGAGGFRNGAAGGGGAGRSQGGAGGASSKQCESVARLDIAKTSYVSRPGMIFREDKDSYTARPITVKAVDAANRPVAQCPLKWEPEAGSGWVFPTATGADGIAKAWWTAGSNDTQRLKISAPGSQVSSIFIDGTTENTSLKDGQPANIVLSTPDDLTGFAVQVTPLTAPAPTDIGAIHVLIRGSWACGAGLATARTDATPAQPTAYFGCTSHLAALEIANDKVGNCESASGSSNNGGISCSTVYPWALNRKYEFDLGIVRSSAEDTTELTVSVRDVAADARVTLGQLRYRQQMSVTEIRSGIFQEYQNSSRQSCLRNEPRAVVFENLRRYDGVRWSALTSISVLKTEDWRTVCANSAYDLKGKGVIQLSTGGKDLVGEPLIFNNKSLNW